MKHPDQHITRLLVVDDDHSFRTLVARALSDDGFEVHQAPDGARAVAEAGNHEFDVILLDVKMPDMDGIQTLRKLREESPSSDVLMLTGVHDIAIAMESVKLGAREYLTKPIDPDVLIQRIRTTLRARDAEKKFRELENEFSSRILYDLRTPLTSVRSAVGFLGRGMAGPLTDQQQEVLNHTTMHVEKMVALLNDMIDLTKFESGRVNLEMIPCNIETIIPSVSVRFDPQMRAKNIVLTIDVDSSIPTLVLDPEKIEQVLVNLLENAVTYTPSNGRITITARTTTQLIDSAFREYVLISVADTGIGISREELPYVLDKYKEFLTGKASSRKHTGLGLAICRRIVEAHHGMLTVESEQGKGSTFIILLPVNER